MKLFIIGAFENPELVPTPTHIFPVIASHCEKGYLRIFYDQNGNPVLTPGNKNYCKDIRNILPYSTIIRSTPIKYDSKSQTILLPNKKIISSTKKTYLIIRVAPYIFTSKIVNSVKTIINILK